MLVENTREEAMKAFMNGRKVRVYYESTDGGACDVQKFEDMLPEEGFHYLVDVPAYENPQLEQDMPIPSVPPAVNQEEQVPPPRKSRRKTW